MQEVSQVFDRIVRPHFDRLYRLAWRLAGAREEAEDLFQEVLIKAFGKLDQLLRIEEPGSWLARMMYNLFVDRHRRYSRQRLVVVDEGQAPGGSVLEFAGEENPERDSQRMEQLEALENALSQLSEEHRIVVVLHDTDGYKLEEIQDLMGIPVGTVKSRLHRARARLRQILTDSGTFSR